MKKKVKRYIINIIIIVYSYTEYTHEKTGKKIHTTTKKSRQVTHIPWYILCGKSAKKNGKINDAQY